MSADAQPEPSPRLGWRRLFGGILLLTALTVILQGRSVHNGLILDDYNHRAELKAGDWSSRSLVNASHLGDPRRRVRMWWQSGADLYFFRPVAFAFLRATYVLGGWRPEAVHIASLGLGTTCASLVFVLGWLSTGRFGWGLLAALLFLLHPNNSGTPRWVACQNEQMATAFTLLGLLAYGQHSGWWRAGQPGGGRNMEDAKPPVDRSRPLCAAITLVCYVAALGCRESAIFMPVLFVVGDLVHRTPRTMRLALRYALLLAVAVAYLFIRRHMLGPMIVPGRPYAWPPSEPGFLGFIAEKFVYYILGLWAYVPIIGFAGQEQMRTNPGIFYGLFAAIVVGWATILWLMRREPAEHAQKTACADRRRIYLWLAVALLPLAPVLPVFAASHHLYLASTGMAIATVTALRGLLDWVGQRTTIIRRAIRAIAIGTVAVLLLVFVGANYALEAGMEGLSATCRLPAAQAVRFGRPPQANDKLFFINLPMLAFNCMPSIEEARGTTPLHGYVLTFAPKFVFMDRPTHVEQVGPQQLRVWLDEPAYFSGLIGRSILQAIDRDRPFAPGESFATPDVNVQIVRATDAGVQEFLFTFEKPLSDPTYHFFLASRVFDAYPLSFK